MDIYRTAAGIIKLFQIPLVAVRVLGTARTNLVHFPCILRGVLKGCIGILWLCDSSASGSTRFRLLPYSSMFQMVRTARSALGSKDLDNSGRKV
jgi:hypothetical protein